jgi:hypothetical protein
VTCKPVSIQIHEADADGTLASRAWTVCSHVSDQIAAMLGNPQSSLIATPEARATMRATWDAIPGVVIHQEGS